MAKFTFIDLFAGIGGFHLAAESVGGKSLGFSEIARDAIQAYCQNFHESPDNNLGDITKLRTLPKHDFMTAGVPCQSWSIAGKKLGFDDDRGQLWNDTPYLLNESRPKAFLFENVKGLADPRNAKALAYIQDRIRQAGYHANAYLLNAYDYGVPQTRVRIYIVGFKEARFFHRFFVPKPCPGRVLLGDVLDGAHVRKNRKGGANTARWSLSCNDQGFNDYFLFNDLRNGDTTVHSWDIQETTEKEKQICILLLKNRRKSQYGVLDGNALSLEHFQSLDAEIGLEDLEGLVSKGILKHVPYCYEVCREASSLEEKEAFLLSCRRDKRIIVDELKLDKEFKRRKIPILDTLLKLESEGIVKCVETRYDFRNGKISTGLNGINRIFLPSSKIYPTLVASDTNDFVTTEELHADTIEQWKANFMREIFIPKKYRKITRAEACRIQGFPADFMLPESRPRWMHLIGNSVAVPVVRMLAKAIAATGVFDESDWSGKMPNAEERRTGLLPNRDRVQLKLAF